jgi:hypothetical protein
MLIAASAQGDAGKVRSLLAAGADVNSATDLYRGATPLIFGRAGGPRRSREGSRRRRGRRRRGDGKRWAHAALYRCGEGFFGDHAGFARRWS